jgi:Tfp pilus assembly protein PilF
MTSATTRAADQLFARAVALSRAGRDVEAFEIVTQILRDHPTHADASLEVARALAGRGRTDEAIHVLARASAAAPSNAMLAVNMGSLLCAQGRAAEGVPVLERACRLLPTSAVAAFNLANGLRDLGRAEEAIVRYRDSIRIDPTQWAAYRNLANLLADRGLEAESEMVRYAAAAARREPPSTGAAARMTSIVKLRHDAEQIEHLLSQGRLPAERRRDAQAYRAALAALPASAPTAKVPLPDAHWPALASTYNRLWNLCDAPEIEGGALSPDLDGAAIEAAYRIQAPGIASFDGLLRPDALASLRRFALESTVWFHFNYKNGYLGAFWDSGFWCPLLAQIGRELRTLLPNLLGPHPLRRVWAFKYDARLAGIPIHADEAAVNVNFWLTPDDANLAPDKGGLIVWDKEAPQDWSFARFNADAPVIRRFLDQNAARPVKVPHRQNRVVLFNSDLFHETDEIVFADGYESRRINVTLLYGKRTG